MSKRPHPQDAGSSAAFSPDNSTLQSLCSIALTMADIAYFTIIGVIMIETWRSAKKTLLK